MQRTPLSFVGYQGLRWGGGPAHGGTEIFFRGTYVSEGTTPAGSVWAQNPIPLTAGDDGLPDDAPSGTPVFKPFFKQKTAYEIRIRDWSSDVCSSD
eukprot:COSAG02_NODE_30541_length_549_cov_0.817778_1_plen_95_part_10